MQLLKTACRGPSDQELLQVGPFLTDARSHFESMLLFHTKSVLAQAARYAMLNAEAE